MSLNKGKTTSSYAGPTTHPHVTLRTESGILQWKQEQLRATTPESDSVLVANPEKTTCHKT